MRRLLFGPTNHRTAAARIYQSCVEANPSLGSGHFQLSILSWPPSRGQLKDIINCHQIKPNRVQTTWQKYTTNPLLDWIFDRDNMTDVADCSKDCMPGFKRNGGVCTKINPCEEKCGKGINTQCFKFFDLFKDRDVVGDAVCICKAGYVKGKNGLNTRSSDLIRIIQKWCQQKVAFLDPHPL